MCGIVAYAGDKRAAEIIYSGLEKLEYRGYDSAGITTLCCGEFYTVKRSGRVCRLSKCLEDMRGTTGIGHTRWATHGEASDVNAHPHLCGRFAIVHNGIIENYSVIKAELAAAGHIFLSQTDSEVVAHVLDSVYDGDLIGAVKKTCSRLEGCWALAILCIDFDGFIAVSRGSPVIIARGKDGFFAASDIPAVADGAQRYCVLQDGDVAIVERDVCKIYSAELKPVQREFVPVEKEQYAWLNDDCPHHMLREIRSNARTIRATCQKFPLAAGGGLYERLRGADKIIFVGCGTAYNSALAAKRLFSGAYDAFIEAVIASEARYNPPAVTDRSVVIAVSQSGETADTLKAAGILKEAGAYLVAVTNTGYSAITRIADKVLPVCAGSEICVAATKSYTGQLACFHLMSALPDYARRKSELLKVADEAEKLAADELLSLRIAGLCVSSRAVFFIGRGGDADVATEAALKLKEVSYIFSDDYPAGELKHGTLALIDEDVLSVVIICDECLAEKSKNAVEQILSRKGKVALVTTIKSVSDEFSGRVSAVWLLPPVPAHLSHFLSAEALQLVAYRAAVLAGRDPDKPRNLAKSVTVE